MIYQTGEQLSINANQKEILLATSSQETQPILATPHSLVSPSAGPTRPRLGLHPITIGTLSIICRGSRESQLLACLHVIARDIKKVAARRRGTPSEKTREDKGEQKKEVRRPLFTFLLSSLSLCLFSVSLLLSCCLVLSQSSFCFIQLTGNNTSKLFSTSPHSAHWFARVAPNSAFSIEQTASLFTLYSKRGRNSN